MARTILVHLNIEADDDDTRSASKIADEVLDTLNGGGHLSDVIDEGFAIPRVGTLAGMRICAPLAETIDGPDYDDDGQMLCPDCGKPTEYSDEGGWRHIDATASCFLYPARPSGEPEPACLRDESERRADYLFVRYDVTGLSDDEVGRLSLEAAVQAEASEADEDHPGHPDVPVESWIEKGEN